MLYLNIRPGPCIGELVDIYISYCESLQGLFCFSVIIQRRLLFNEVRKSRFQFCGEERMHTDRQIVIFYAIPLKICFKWMSLTLQKSHDNVQMRRAKIWIDLN